MATAYLEFVDANGKTVYRSYTAGITTLRPIDFIPRALLYMAHRAWIEDHGDVMMVKDRTREQVGPVDEKEFFIVKLKSIPSARPVKRNI
jgi:hypothetical protein